MTKRSTAAMTVGLDLGDRFSTACVLDTRTGRLLHEWRLRTTRAALARRFEGVPPMRIALEVGSHSPWASRLLACWGHDVLIANPRRVRLIAHSRRKSDRFDGQTLARLARLDPELLAPVRHRSAAAQHDLAVLRARAALVRSRTLLINHLRGAVKAVGGRLREDGGGFDHFDHEGRAPAREIVARADAAEQPVDEAEPCRDGGDKAARLREHDDERILAEKGRFAAHIGAGDEPEPVAFR